MNEVRPPVLRPLVIVGPTASGKTALAVELARRMIDRGVSVEIISGDAMAVYRGMDIGTAKPSVAERRGVPHHLIDVVAPSVEFTVGRFRDEVDRAITAIEDGGGVPILAGGTGLYVQSVVDGLAIPGRYPEIRADLEASPDTDAATIAMWERLRALDPTAAAKMEPNNRRRVIRALEVCLGSGRPFSSFGPGIDAYPPSRFLQAGLRVERAVMDARIDARYRQQMAEGFLDEVRDVLNVSGGPSRTARQALGYRELAEHLAGNCSLEDALDTARRRTRRFARRQQRWFERDPRITWFDHDAPELVDEIETWWEDSSK